MRCVRTDRAIWPRRVRSGDWRPKLGRAAPHGKRLAADKGHPTTVVLPPERGGQLAAPGTPDPTPRVKALRDKVALLAERLYQLDTDSQVQLLDDAAQYRGRTATVVNQAGGGVATLWKDYGLLRDVLEDMQRAIDAKDFATVTGLLDGRGLTRADGGTVTPDALAESLRRNAEEIVAVAARVSSGWQDIIPRLDAARAAVGQLDERAASLGIPGSDVLQRARSKVYEATAMITTDPLGIDLHGVEQALATARGEIDRLGAERDGLDGLLATATRDLAALRALIPAGAAALAAAQDLVLRPAGLLTPLDPEIVDGDAQSLAPWLERLADRADHGDWRAAAQGLAQWRRQIDAHLANARRIHAANLAPVQQRDDLRGLLDGFRAKAAAKGLAEHPGLAEAHAAAREVLFVAPCPLDLAETRVRQFQAALETASMGATQ